MARSPVPQNELGEGSTTRRSRKQFNTQQSCLESVTMQEPETPVAGVPRLHGGIMDISIIPVGKFPGSSDRPTNCHGGQVGAQEHFVGWRGVSSNSVARHNINRP